MATNCDQPASCTLLASLVRASPLCGRLLLRGAVQLPVRRPASGRPGRHRAPGHRRVPRDEKGIGTAWTCPAWTSRSTTTSRPTCRAGGPFGQLSQFYGEYLGMERAGVSLADGERTGLTVEGRTELSYEPLTDPDGSPTKIRNAMFGFASEFEVGRTTGRSDAFGLSSEASYGETAEYVFSSEETGEAHGRVCAGTPSTPSTPSAPYPPPIDGIEPCSHGSSRCSRRRGGRPPAGRGPAPGRPRSASDGSGGHGRGVDGPT